MENKAEQRKKKMMDLADASPLMTKEEQLADLAMTKNAETESGIECPEIIYPEDGDEEKMRKHLQYVQLKLLQDAKQK